MAKKKKNVKTDGFGPYEKSKVRAAVRDVWRHSLPHKLVRDRCSLKDGYSKCELCRKKVPKIFVNHKITVGDVDEGFLKRMFVSADLLEGICDPCHKPITAAERKISSAKRKAEKKVQQEEQNDFF